MLFRLQLNEIRKVKLSSIFCDNSDDINNMQVFIFQFSHGYRKCIFAYKWFMKHIPMLIVMLATIAR